MLAFKMRTYAEKNILADSANFGRTCLDLLSTDKQTGNGLALSLSPLSNSLICSWRTFIHEKCGQGSLEAFKFWSSRQLD